MNLAQLQERLAMYLEAEKTVLEANQSFTTPDGTSYTRADLRTISAKIDKIRNDISCLQGGYGAQSFSFPGRR